MRRKPDIVIGSIFELSVSSALQFNSKFTKFFVKRICTRPGIRRSTSASWWAQSVIMHQHAKLFPILPVEERVQARKAGVLHAAANRAPVRHLDATTALSDAPQVHLQLGADLLHHDSDALSAARPPLLLRHIPVRGGGALRTEDAREVGPPGRRRQAVALRGDQQEVSPVRVHVHWSLPSRFNRHIFDSRLYAHGSVVRLQLNQQPESFDPYLRIPFAGELA